MTREIKFRAWDKKSNKMIGDVGIFDKIAVIEQEYVFDRPNKEIIELKGSIIMQYTGLKDKNGKEIYEGDIVKDLDNNVISEIEWESPCFIQRIRLAYEKLNKVNYRKPEYEGGITGLADGTGLEVIGNIYEQPELIV